MDEKKIDPVYAEELEYREKDMSSDEYAREIERTRQEIDDTLHTLEERLSPAEIWDRTINEWGGGVKEFSSNLGRSVRDNPLPATLMGISLLWLMASGSGKAADRSAEYERRKSRLRERYAEVKSRVEGNVENVSGKMKDAGARMKEMSDEVRHRGEHIREQGHEWREKMQTGGADLAGRPVFLALAGLALGSLAALSLPMTRKEEEVIGPRGEQLVEKAREFGSEQVSRARDAAAAVGETLREELEKEEKEKEENEKIQMESV
jgi:hypothetical protein